jgi:hypothetical protein
MQKQDQWIPAVVALSGDPLINAADRNKGSFADRCGRQSRVRQKQCAQAGSQAPGKGPPGQGISDWREWHLSLQKFELTDISIFDNDISVNRYIDYWKPIYRIPISDEPLGEREMPRAHHLFTATGWVLNAGMLVSLFLTGILVLAFGVCVLAATGIVHLPIPAEDLKELKDISLGLVFVAGAVACASGVFLLALLSLVLLMTARIVKTAETDPFVEDNARRLMQIGWLLLAMQAVGFTADMVISLFPKTVSDHVQAGFDLSPIGILAVLLIFVLAQIFRRGAQMRAELEGTV